STNLESTGILVAAARGESNPSCRIQALDSLGSRMADAASFGAAREALFRDAEENVRLAALASVCRSADPSVKDILQQLSTDAQATPALKKAAANWMERLKGK